MRTTFTRFDKGLFLKVHRYTIVYYIKLNSGVLTTFSLIRIFSEGPAVCHNLIFDIYLWTAYTRASLFLEKLFSGSRFYDIPCFSILASGPHLMLLILQRVFWEDPVLMLLYLIVDSLYGCFSCFKGLFQ